MEVNKINNMNIIDNEIDLFDNIESLPEEVYRTIMWHSNDDATYYNCEELKQKLEEFSYTFEYGLDGIPYNLIKIK